MRRTFCLGTLAVLTSSCISFNYVSVSANEPINAAAVDSLEPGTASLASCLDRLGAPEIVWSSEHGQVHLAYAWVDTVDWGLSASYSFSDGASVGLEWDSTDADIPAVVLLFGPELQLRHLEFGFLRDLLPNPPESDPGLDLLRDSPG